MASPSPRNSSTLPSQRPKKPSAPGTGGRRTQTPSPIRARTSKAAMGGTRLARASNPFPGSDGPPPDPTLPDAMSNPIHPTHRMARTSRQPVMIQRTLLPRGGAAGSFDMRSLRGRKKPKSQGTEQGNDATTSGREGDPDDP